MDKLKTTKRVYDFLWRSVNDISIPEACHFDRMKEVINDQIVRGAMGIDIGSGCGYDTYAMASNNPAVRIVSIDLSDGVHKTKKLTSMLKNVQLIKCSTLDIPIRDNVFDFAYSFGVLHHTIDPQKGLLEISRILKKQRPAFLYLYDDHSENIIKYIAVKIISKLRVVTVRIPVNMLYALCFVFSPFVFILFSVPSRILRGFKRTAHIASMIPFNFGTGLFSLRRDLYDRFSAPVEYRFSRKKVYDLFARSGFQDINITRLKESAGWVVWGYKK
jgi:SAM-dependent methyltransferase